MPVLVKRGLPKATTMGFFGLLMLALLCWSGAARADDPVASFGSGSFESTRHGVEELALSGNPRAATII